MAFADKQAKAKGELSGNVTPSQENHGPRSSSTDWIQHKVRSGESLDKIAGIYEVSIADIKRWNNLRSSRIRVGQYIDIYDKPDERVKIIPANPKIISGSKVPLTTSSTGIFSPTHKVKKGETIFEIAKKYGVNIKSIRKANGLHSNKIMVGQVLKIPTKSES